jgi:hypothetical protein
MLRAEADARRTPTRRRSTNANPAALDEREPGRRRSTNAFGGKEGRWFGGFGEFVMRSVTFPRNPSWLSGKCDWHDRVLTLLDRTPEEYLHGADVILQPSGDCGDA